MTVAELRDYLENFNQDLPVVVECEHSTTAGHEIEKYSRFMQADGTLSLVLGIDPGYLDLERDADDEDDEDA